MKKLLIILNTIIFCACANLAYANNSIVVVANINQTNLTLSKQEVRNLFMGGSVGYDLTAIDLPQSNEIRILFNTKVVGLTEARIQSYWAQMRFSGRKKAPKQLDDTATVISFLQRNRGAVAYLPANEPIPTELTVVYTSE